MAVEDDLALAQCLRDQPDVGRALDAFESIRRAPTEEAGCGQRAHESRRGARAACVQSIESGGRDQRSVATWIWLGVRWSPRRGTRSSGGATRSTGTTGSISK